MADSDPTSEPDESSDVSGVPIRVSPDTLEGQGPEVERLRRLMERNGLTLVSGATFEGGREVLDGNIYDECKFINVDLVFQGINMFVFMSCEFDEVGLGVEKNAMTTLVGMGYLRGAGFGNVVEDIVENLTKPFSGEDEDE